MKAYRFGLFDLDGTLIDSFQGLTTALNRAAAEQGYRPLTMDEVRGMVGEGVESLVRRAFAVEVIPKQLMTSFEAHYDDVCCEESRVLDDVVETLSILAKEGVVMGVCTNKPTSFSLKILRYLGLERHFRAVVGPDRAGARKPDPAHVLRTLEEIGGDAPSTLFVGDMPIDVSAARNAGIDIAAVATGSAREDELHAASPDYLLARFSQLPSLFAGRGLRA